jgi:hypothetical protein
LIPEDLAETEPGRDYLFNVDRHLNPGTEYVVKMRVVYKNRENRTDETGQLYYEWPLLDTNIVRLFFSTLDSELVDLF